VCSGLGHLIFAVLILGIYRVSHLDRTDQPNEMRGAGETAKPPGPWSHLGQYAPRFCSTAGTVCSSSLMSQLRLQPVTYM
jgi:hypothetical protein